MADDLQGKRIVFLVANEGIEQVELTSPWGAVEKASARNRCWWPVPLAGCRLSTTWTGGNLRGRPDNPGCAGIGLRRHGPTGWSCQCRSASDRYACGKPDSGVLRVGAPRGRYMPRSVGDHRSGSGGGRTLTSWPSLQTDLRNAGATWVDAEVHVYESGPNILVSSRKPDDLEAFNAALIEVFSSARNAEGNGKPRGYADPQDLQFATSARDKEERLERALAEGEPVPPDEPASARPRAANKARPR